ncbi:MAG: transposase [Planctomycetota bacterium]|jgi:transposase|nr:transposase [Planctomycetota bacterium]
MSRQKYDTDVTDAEWAIFEKMILAMRKSPKGRKAGVPRREVINAILYRLRTGCQWRNLPHGFPAWGTVYRTYRRWILNGYWERIHDALCRKAQIQNERGQENPERRLPIRRT